MFNITERVHNGLRLIAQLADGASLSVAEISAREQVSASYLEEIALTLRQAGIIVGTRGRNGGYRLAKPSDAVTVHDVVCALEGPIALVPCQNADGFSCPVESTCSSQKVWHALKENIQQTLENITVAQFTKKV